MIEKIVGGAVVAAHTRADSAAIRLFAVEEAVVARSVPKRRAEFTAVRGCVREALAALGLPPSPIVPGPRGEPRWPAGVVGSLTHCAGYRAAVLGRARDVVAVGIDAEPNEAIGEGVLAAIARPEERAWIGRLAPSFPDVAWDRLVFSAKESVYKAWFPLTGRRLDFEEAVIGVDPALGTFTARLLVPGPRVNGRPLTGFSGRWLAADGLVVTAIVLERAAGQAG